MKRAAGFICRYGWKGFEMKTAVKKIVTSDEVYEDLLGKIIKLEFLPGDGISENELCEVYGTTRHVIRGALSVLKNKGLVEVYPQRGTFVSLIDLKFIDDVLFIREGIEQETIHAIFKNKDNSELVKELKECIKKQKAITSPQDSQDEFYALDEEFHMLLRKSVGRENAINIIEDALLHVKRWRNIELGTLERMGELPYEHEKIAEAIEMGDESQARHFMNMHIDVVSNYGETIKKMKPGYFA